MNEGDQAAVPSDAAEIAAPAGGWPPMRYWAGVALTVVAVVAVASAAVMASSVLILIVTALVLGIGLQRPINWLERRGLGRGVAAAVIVAVVIVVVGVVTVLVAPSISRSVGALVQDGPETFDRLKRQHWVADLDRRFEITDKLERLGDDLPDRAVTLGKGVVTVVGGGLTLLVLTLYFAVALPRLIEGVGRLMLPDRRAQFELIAREVTDRIGGYVVGNGIVSVIAGVTTFVGLLAIGVPFAAALAFWVALTDLIPAVGALIGAAVVLAVAAGQSLGAFLATLAFVTVYQQIENYVVVPRVMRNSVDMSVGGVLVSILIGGELFGVTGVLLALPVAASARAVVEELYLKERRAVVQRQVARRRLRRARARAATATAAAATTAGGDPPAR